MLPPDICPTCMESLTSHGELCPVFLPVVSNAPPKTLGDWHRNEMPDDWEDAPDLVDILLGPDFARQPPPETSWQPVGQRVKVGR